MKLFIFLFFVLITISDSEILRPVGKYSGYKKETQYSSRNEIGRYSYLDSPFNFSFGLDCLIASNIYPGVNLELYIMLVGLKVGFGSIRYLGDNSELNDQWIGSVFRIGITHREFIRIFDKSKFLNLLILEPSINHNNHSLSVLGEKSVSYNYISINLRVALASSWLEIFAEPAYVLPNYDKELKLSRDFLFSLGITFHYGRD